MLRLVASLVIALAFAWFASLNWVAVPVRLGGTIAHVVQLPVLLLAAALTGAIPTWLFVSARAWQLQRRLARAERTLAERAILDARGASPDRVPAPAPPQPRAEPLIVPPAGA